MAQCNIQTLLNNAACFANLPPGMWDVIELQLLCEILNAGGGGGSGAPDYIAYAGPPTVAPPSLQNIVVDSNGVQWMYFNNQWN